MDSEGFLPLGMIVGFPRVRQLTGNVSDLQSFIISCLRDSEKVELNEDSLKVLLE